MCGIAGILSLSPSVIDKMNICLRRMTDALAHRGPDGEGFWQSGNSSVGLGHRRLKIIDLSENAAQPMHFGNRYTIVYNGEIYNFPELKKELSLKNYHFKTESDTEVILAAYDCWNETCLGHFDGMFSFAIWDEETRTLFCARDRFGEKPFYYFRDDKQFLFASEMKALWAAGVERNVQNSFLLNYITIGLVQNPASPEQTFFENIYSLAPGFFLKLRMPSFDIQVVNYWDIDKETTDQTISESDALEKFSRLLNRSVHRRLRSDVRVGSSLSGGLDSSSMVSLIQEFQKKTASQSIFNTFSAVFPDFEKDESKYIAQVAGQYGVKNFQITPSSGQLLNDFDNLLCHQEEPFQSLSIYAQYKVYELAGQEGVTVILDGQGADETLAGYHKYYPWYWQELFRGNPKELRQARTDAEKLGLHIPWGFRNKLAAFLPELAAQKLQKKAFRLQAMNKNIEQEFFSAGYNKYSLTKPAVRKLNDILYYHTMQLGLQELLRYADRNSMAHGREVRLPFLDHELVQFVFSLPVHFKIREGWTKWILRKSMQHKLPESIVWRKDKVGFEPPQEQWMKSREMHEKIMESRKKLVEARILKPGILQQPVQAGSAHQNGNDDFRYLCAAAMV